MAPSKNLNINKQPLRQRVQRELPKNEESDENGKIGTRGANEKRKSSSFNIVRNKLKELFGPSA